jgi:CRAL/TRIO domain
MVVKKRGVLKDAKKQLLLYIYTMEQAIARMKDGVYQVIMIFDMELYSKSNSPPISVTLELLGVLSNHYPERMYTTYFVYQPRIFSLFYNILWPFLDARQASKINLVGREFEKVLEVIDGSQLEKKYGGERENVERPFEGVEDVDGAGLNSGEGENVEGAESAIDGPDVDEKYAGGTDQGGFEKTQSAGELTIITT